MIEFFPRRERLLTSAASHGIRVTLSCQSARPPGNKYRPSTTTSQESLLQGVEVHSWLGRIDHLGNPYSSASASISRRCCISPSSYHCHLLHIIQEFESIHIIKIEFTRIISASIIQNLHLNCKTRLYLPGSLKLCCRPKDTTNLNEIVRDHTLADRVLLNTSGFIGLPCDLD